MHQFLNLSPTIEPELGDGSGIERLKAAIELILSLGQSLRSARRKAARERAKVLRALADITPAGWNVFLPRTQPQHRGFAGDDEQDVYAYDVAPRQRRIQHVLQLGSTRRNEPLPSLLTESLNFRSDAQPLASFSCFVEASRNWRSLLMRAQPDILGRLLPRHSLERLFMAVTHFVLGFFGARKVDGKNTP